MKQPRAFTINLKTALAIAIAVHALLILGLEFIDGEAPAKQSLDVTFSSNIKSNQAPKDAKHIAANNQEGSGTAEEGLKPTTTEQANRQGDTVSEVAKTQQSVINDRAAQSVVTTQAKQLIKAAEGENQDEQDQQREGQDALEKQLAEIRALEARLAKEQQAYAQRPKIHRFTSVAALAAVDAQYQLHWQEKVESMGNDNYPKSAVAQGLQGDVTLMVSLYKNGSVKAIQLIKSSGSKLLDQSAISSVQLAAPFAAFPKELAAKADILEIFRTWQFRNNQLTTVEGL